MKERILEQVELKEYEGYRVGDRVSFITPKDWIIERIVKQKVEIENTEDKLLTHIIDKVFFVNGAGWVRPGAFKEFIEKEQPK